MYTLWPLKTGPYDRAADTWVKNFPILAETNVTILKNADQKYKFTLTGPMSSP